MKGSGDFSIDVTSPVGRVRTTNTGELVEAIAQRIHACYPDGMPDDFMRYAPGFIRWAIEAAVLAEREAAIRDVCMWCAGHAKGYEAAEGPNSAGNWIHRAKGDKTSTPVLCKASAIHARNAAQDPTPGEGRER